MPRAVTGVKRGTPEKATHLRVVAPSLRAVLADHHVEVDVAALAGLCMFIEAPLHLAAPFGEIEPTSYRVLLLLDVERFEMFEYRGTRTSRG